MIYLSCTDVAGSLVSPDVLLPGLKSKTIHFFPSGISGPRINILLAQIIIAPEVVINVPASFLPSLK